MDYKWLWVPVLLALLGIWWFVFTRVRVNGHLYETTVPPVVTAVWLFRRDTHVIVCVEIDGEWRRILMESHDSEFSRVVGLLGMRAAPVLASSGGS